VIGLVLAVNPTQPGERITMPGAVFPIYAKTSPPHHLPQSPQAISLSDVTVTDTPVQEKVDAVHVSEVIQLSTAVPVSAVSVSVAPVPIAVPVVAAPMSAEAVAAPVAAAPASVRVSVAPVGAPAIVAPQAAPVTQSPMAKLPQLQSILQPVISGGNPAGMQWFQQMMFPFGQQPMFGFQPQPIAPAKPVHSGRPAAPDVSSAVPFGYPHASLLPLTNPFKGSSFENMMFPFNAYGYPFLGTHTPFGYNGFGLMSPLAMGMMM